MRYPVFVNTLAAALAALAPAQTPDPNKLKDQITGTAKAPPSVNPQCKLFTPAEIAAYASGLGCNWHNQTYCASVTVSVVPPNYFPEPSAVRGFKRLPGVGSKGWVAPDSGWSAGAVVQDTAVVVVVSGAKSTEAAAVALLQEAQALIVEP